MPAIKTQTVPSLDKALGILELLTRSRVGLTLPELTEQSRWAKSSVHYLLVTLERRGYLHRNQRTSRYLLGEKVFSLANWSLNGLSVRERAVPLMSALRMRTGLTVHVAVLEQNEDVLISKQEAVSGVRLATWVGKRMDLHCTGLGKAFIAFLPQSATDSIIREHGLSRHNENTISSPRRLREDLEGVVRRGYALDDEEDELGTRCIGVPIFGPQKLPLATISLAGTVSQIVPENLTRLIGDLKAVASAIGSLCPRVDDLNEGYTLQGEASASTDLALPNRSEVECDGRQHGRRRFAAAV